MKRVLKMVMALVVVMMGMMMGKFIWDRGDDYAVDRSGVPVPTYEESEIIFNQGNAFTESLPFLASAIIDINNDGVEELFLGGSKNTSDGMFEYKNGALVAISGNAGLSKGKTASLWCCRS